MIKLKDEVMNIDSYTKIFDLSDADLNKSLLCITENISANLSPCISYKQFVNDESKKQYKTDQFELALSVDLLLLGQTYSESFYLALIKEACRIAGEIRLFPIMDEEGKVVPMLGPMMISLQAQGYGVEVREVQNGNGAILRVWKTQCEVS